MHLTINSRKVGREVCFSRPGAGYIYVDLNDQPGTLGNQICYGGGLSGSTITYHGEDQEEFEAVCRRWWKSYLRDQNAQFGDAAFERY